MDLEQWNNAARRRGQRTKGRTRRTDGKHLAMEVDGTPHSRDAEGPSQCRLREITIDLEGKMAESYC